MSKRNAIFVSYRRTDADGFARLLHRELLEWYDADSVYFDRHSSKSGTDYVAGIDAALEEASVVLVLIGRQWIGELAERARHDERDMVQFEVEKALRRHVEHGITVIPVLTGIDSVPAADDLPPSVAGLVKSLFVLQSEPLYSGKVDQSAFQFRSLLGSLTTIPGVPPPSLRPLPEREGYKRPFSVGTSEPTQRFSDPDHRLDQLRELLIPAERSGRVVVSTISGMAGVGKSELALQFVMQNRTAFGGGVWWLPGDSEIALREAAAEACGACLIPLHEDDDPCAMLRAWLEQTHRSWLIVVDNLLTWDMAKATLPRVGPHSILITTRDLAADQAIALAPWSESAAAAYLQDCLRGHPFPAPAPQLRRLACALGGVPLALAHAAAYLNATSQRIEQYVESLEDVAKAPSLLASLSRRESVLATLRTSLEHCDSTAQRLLETLACFADQPVPERWLRESANARLPSDQALISDDLSWNELIAQLRSFALVDRVGTYPPGMRLREKVGGKRSQPALQLNRLTQQSLLAVTTDGAAPRRIATQLLAEAARKELQVPGRTAEYACLVNHLVFRGTLDNDIEAAGLLRLAAELHKAKGDFAAAYECNKQWMKQSLELQGANVVETVESQVLLAEAVADLSRSAEALPLAQRAREDATRLCQENDELLARAYSLEARCSAAMGNVEEALEIYRARLLDAYVLSHSNVTISPWLLRGLQDLGDVLLALGRTKTALWAQAKVLELAEGELGPWHDTTLTCAAALAKTWSALGEFGKAIQLWRLAAEGRIANSGTYHPGTIAALTGLADALLHLGKFDEALSVYDEALTCGNLTLPYDDVRLRALREGLKLAQEKCADRAP